MVLRSLACLIALTFATPAFADPAEGLRLTFGDEFTTLSLRSGGSGVWSTTFGYGGVANRTLPANRELQIYVEPGFMGTGSRPLNVRPFEIGDGVLNIRAQRISRQTARRMWGYRYTSGLLTTRESFAQSYGYFEVRARLPEGRGLWPAFWLLPATGDWPPEIDVMEHLGREPTTIHVGLKTGAGPDGGVLPFTVETATSDFHRYGVLWTREQVAWFIDGVEVRRMATPADMHEPMYMLVNLAVGGPWAHRPSWRTRFPATMQVDYVRAYALAGE